MKKSVAIVLGLLLLIVFLTFSTTYTVGFYQVAVKTRFGAADSGSVVTKAGLNFKLPFFIDQVYTFDTRVQVVETPKEGAATADGLQIVYQAYLLWRVDKDGDGPREFHVNMRTIEDADEELRERLVTKTTSVLGRYDFDALIGLNSKLEEAEQAILAELQREQGEGVLPVSVGLSQILLPTQTTRAVLQRMQATRSALTENERTKSNAEQTRITSIGRTQSAKIIEFAQALAAEIRAQGDREAAQYYAHMAATDEDLAIFLQELETIKRTLTETTTLILDQSIAPFHLMNLEQTVGANGIPIPPKRGEASAPAAGPTGSTDGDAQAATNGDGDATNGETDDEGS